MVEDHGRPDDTVSLRELYLVWRRGLVLILVVAALCAAAAVAVRAARGSTYTARAIVQVTRPRVTSQPGAGLDVTVATALDAGTYAAVANDPALLVEVASSLGAAGPAELGRLVVSPGPGPQSGDALTLTHRVSLPADAGAERAAEVANAWAAAAVAAARELATAPWEAATERVAADAQEREAEYQAASAAWAEFLGVDERAELRRRLESLVDLDAGTIARLESVEAEAAGLRARLDAGAGASVAEDLAALEAEAAQLREDVATSAGRGDDLRTTLGELEGRAATLQRRVSAASLAFFRAAPAQASVELQRDLAAASVSVALPAATPTDRDARGLLPTALFAFLVGGLAATVFVFLRAAVREPGPVGERAVEAHGAP